VLNTRTSTYQSQINFFVKPLQNQESPSKKCANAYTFGFNGQEKTDEISGSGNHYTAEFWEMDPRIARRWNQDPKPNPSISNYAIYANNPIWFVDPLGDTTNYYTKKGKYLGTLYGEQGLNDRTINEKQYNKLMKEKYLFENVTVGNYNIYFHDPSKSYEDYLDTDQMEAFLNNQNNVKSEVLDLNSDLGYMTRAVYAEMRGGDANAKSIVAESIRNRAQLAEGSYERADGTYTGVVNKFYDVSKSGNATYNVFKNPYNYARKNDTEMGAWQASVSAALQAHNGNSSIGQGVIFYHSTSSTYWDKNSQLQKINLGITVRGIKGLWKLK